MKTIKYNNRSKKWMVIHRLKVLIEIATLLNQVVINNIETYLAINIYCLDCGHDRGFAVLADLHSDMI